MEKDDVQIRKRMREIAREKKRYVYRRIHVILQREGIVQNHKRTERIYREEGLSLKKRSKKRRRSGIRVPLPTAQKLNEIWLMDFMNIKGRFSNSKWYKGWGQVKLTPPTRDGGVDIYVSSNSTERESTIWGTM